MPELKTYVCPNCGANTTNAENCEYCGSLLVRFVEKGIDFSHTTYTSNDTVIAGLIPELKRNLQLQKDNPIGTVIATDIFKLNDDGNIECLNIFSSGFKAAWADGTIAPFPTDERGFRIAVGFSTYANANDSRVREFNNKMDAQLARFQRLDSFPLFTPHQGAFTDPWGQARYDREYAIDFGEDVEGAARLISEILFKVNGYSQDTVFDMFTNVGDNIQRARNDWCAAHGKAVNNSAKYSAKHSANDGCAGMIIAGLILAGVSIVALL